MDNLIKDIALKAGDINFDEFDQYVYRKCLLAGKRIVAKRYNLVQRLYTTVTYLDDDVESPRDSKDIILPLTNFISEYEVLVNDVIFNKVDRLTVESQKEYVIVRDENQILFNFWGRQTEDEVKIYFTSDINSEDSLLEELEAVIPSQYNEEVVGFALVEIAKLGIVKYASSEKGERKYTSLLKLYSKDQRDLDKELLKNQTWTRTKVWKPY